MILTRDDAVSEFTEKVKRCRREKSPEIIDNVSTEYAAVLLAELLGFAKDEKVESVLILSGRLFTDVYDKLVGQLKSLLNSGCKVKVIALSSRSMMEESAFFRTVREHDLGDVACLEGEARSENHFVVVGDSAYRYETSDSFSTAIATFNDQSGVVLELRKRFEKLWNRSGENHASGARLFGSA